VFVCFIKLILSVFFLEEDFPTVQYNSAVLSDMLSLDSQKFLEDVLEQNPQVRDGVILLKVWARQRQLHDGLGALNGHIISFLVAYLFHIKKINSSMSSYQVIRITWNYLSKLVGAYVG